MPPSGAVSTMVPSLSTSLGGWGLAKTSKVWRSPEWPWHGPQGGSGADSSSLPRQCEDQCQWLSHLHHQCPRGQSGRLPLCGLQPLWCCQQCRQPCGARYEVARVALSLSPCALSVPRALVSPFPCPPYAPGTLRVVSLSPCWCPPCHPDTTGVMVSLSPSPFHASGAPGVVVSMSPCWCPSRGPRNCDVPIPIQVSSIGFRCS